MATSSVEFMRHSSVQIRGGAPDYQNYLCSCNNVITDEQIMAAFKMAGHDHLDADDLTVTRDTIADFKRAARTFWVECKETSDAVYTGFAAVEFGGVQINRNQTRHALTVIDFGDVRVVLK